MNPLDGQQRVLSTICAFEHALQSPFIPSHYCKLHDEIPLPNDTHIHHCGNVTWMYSEDLSHLRVAVKANSEAMNKSGSSYIPGSFINKVAKKLGSINNSTGKELKELIILFNDFRFLKSTKVADETLNIRGKDVLMSPLEYHNLVQYPFACFVHLTALAQAKSPIPANIKWGPNHSSGNFKQKVFALIEADNVSSWAFVPGKGGMPLNYAVFVEPLFHCTLSLSVAQNFVKIYDRKFTKTQERLIPHSPRPKGHSFKCEDRKLWEFLEFFYHGFQRPVDYIVHFLTEFVVRFTWDVRIFTNGKLLKNYFEAMKKRHKEKLWEMLPDLINPPCYWVHLMEVDDHHFPGMYEPNTPFYHLAKALPNGEMLKNPRSVRRLKNKDVDAYLMEDPPRNKTPFDKRGYHRFSMAVREAVYDQILPVIAKYGMNPIVKLDVVPQDTLRLISQ